MELNPEARVGEKGVNPLARRVHDALMLHTESAGLDVRVDELGDGAVRLHGIVDTLSQKEAAEAIARQVPGVHRVVNDIAVHGEPRWDDKEVEEELNARLARNERTRAVEAEVSGGAVTLVGHASDSAAEAEAMRIAMGTPAVREVRSEIKVGEGGDADDARVARAARQQLAAMGLDPGQFTVWCLAGTLHIRGLVETEEDARRIERAMARLEGVQRVEALLPVDPDSPGAEVPTGRGGKDMVH